MILNLGSIIQHQTHSHKVSPASAKSHLKKTPTEIEYYLEEEENIVEGAHTNMAELLIHRTALGYRPALEY